MCALLLYLRVSTSVVIPLKVGWLGGGSLKTFFFPLWGCGGYKNLFPPPPGGVWGFPFIKTLFFPFGGFGGF